MTERLGPESLPVTLNNHKQISDLINAVPTLEETRNRFREIFFRFREEKRVKRHEQRVRFLTEVQNRGEIVFNDRVEIDS